MRTDGLDAPTSMTVSGAAIAAVASAPATSARRGDRSMILIRPVCLTKRERRSK
jgi:hypothetical protein